MDRSDAHNILKRLKSGTEEVLGKFSGRASGYYNKKKRKTLSLKARLRAWLSSEGVRYFKYLKPYGAYVFIYGLLLNYTLYVLLTQPFPSLTVQSVPAYGIGYYFVKEETTEYVSMIVRKIKGIE